MHRRAFQSQNLSLSCLASIYPAEPYVKVMNPSTTEIRTSTQESRLGSPDTTLFPLSALLPLIGASSFVSSSDKGTRCGTGIHHYESGVTMKLKLLSN